MSSVPPSTRKISDNCHHRLFSQRKEEGSSGWLFTPRLALICGPQLAGNVGYL